MRKNTLYMSRRRKPQSRDANEAVIFFGHRALAPWQVNVYSLSSNNQNRGTAPARKKISVSKATMFMKTLGVATKCHHKKAKIRRKSDRFIGHLRQSEADFAESCGFGRSI